MRKQLSIKLSIPAPCHESWDNMQPNERGRFCSNCNKTVVDFTLYTDKQLVEYFSKVKESVCGKLATYQLDRVLIYNEVNTSFLHKLFYGMALTMGLTGSVNGNYNPNNIPLLQQQNEQTQKKQAQNKTPQHTNQNKQSQGQPHTQTTQKKSARKPVAKPDTHYMEGYAKDARTLKHLAFIMFRVWHGGQLLGDFTTDIDGYYSFHLPDSLKGKDIIIVSYPDYSGYDLFNKAITLSNIPFTYNLYVAPSPPIEPEHIVTTYSVGMLRVPIYQTVNYECIPAFDLNAPNMQPNHTSVTRKDTPY